MKKLLFIICLSLFSVTGVHANTINDSTSTGGIKIDSGGGAGGASERLIINDLGATFNGAQTGGTYPMRVVWPNIQFYDHYFKRWSNSCNISSGSCVGRTGNSGGCTMYGGPLWTGYIPANTVRPFCEKRRIMPWIFQFDFNRCRALG